MGWLSSMLRRSERKTDDGDGDTKGPQPSEKAPLAQHSDPLSLLADQSGKRDEFLRRIATGTVWILALRPAYEFEIKSPDELLGRIQEDVRALEQNEFGEVYTYLRKGSKVLPIFSTTDAAIEFIKRLRHRAHTSVQSVQCIEMKPDFWANANFALTRVFFNPFSNVQTELSETEIERIRLIVRRAGDEH